METLVLITCGSHLYGTATAQSDVDIKGIYLPEARDILLQRVKEVISMHRQKKMGEKNTPEDVDYDLFSPARYLSLVAHGQMIALEMLYAPQAFIRESCPTWQAMQECAPRILTKQAASFVGYCKTQANKYCIKGARIETANQLIELLKKSIETHGTAAKLGIIRDQLVEFTKLHEYFILGHQDASSGTRIEYGEIGGKKALLTSSLKNALTIFENLLEEYGHRAQLAAQHEGIDWKALSHAVRIGHQALEFLHEHHITFPRPEAEHLIAIRQGLVPLEEVTEEIERLLHDVEEASTHSTLPDTYDQKIIDGFIEYLYLKQITNTYG